MTLLRRLLSARVGPDLGSSTVIQPVMTTVGVFTFLAGAYSSRRSARRGSR